MITQKAVDSPNLLKRKKPNASLAMRSFSPIINEQMENLNSVLKKDFPLIKYCIWSTEWLNGWATHQSVRTFIIVEVEDASESLFYHLKTNGFKNVFLEPDALLMERYIADAENPIIVQKLVGRSPLLTVKAGNSFMIKVPKLEKILVDIYCDDILFFAYRGYEQKQLFKNVFNKFDIDTKTLFAYAERRKRKASLFQYLQSIEIVPL